MVGVVNVRLAVQLLITIPYDHPQSTYKRVVNLIFPIITFLTTKFSN